MKDKFLKKLFIVLFVIFVSVAGAWAFSFRNMTLDFIHISDTHIANRPDTSYKAIGSSHLLLKDAIEQINLMKGLDFVFFTGDMVDEGKDEYFDIYYRLLSKLKYPSLNTIGNHELYGNRTKDEVIEIFKKYNPNYIFDKTYYAFSPKTDFRIIALDATIENVNNAVGAISDEQLQFLDNELAQHQDKVILIGMHHAPIQPFVANDHAILNADKINEILIKYKNPIIVASGHYHATKIRRIGNIVYVSTPSMVTYPMAFRHIKITNFKDRVKYEFDFIPTRLEDIKEKNRQGVLSYAILEGDEKDRKISFTYMKKHPKSLRYKRNQIKKVNKQTKTTEKEIEKLNKPTKKELKEKKREEKIQKTQSKQEKTKKEGIFSKIFKKKELTPQEI